MYLLEDVHSTPVECSFQQNWIESSLQTQLQVYRKYENKVLLNDTVGIQANKISDVREPKNNNSVSSSVKIFWTLAG